MTKLVFLIVLTASAVAVLADDTADPVKCKDLLTKLEDCRKEDLGRTCDEGKTTPSKFFECVDKETKQSKDCKSENDFETKQLDAWQTFATNVDATYCEAKDAKKGTCKDKIREALQATLPYKRLIAPSEYVNSDFMKKPACQLQSLAWRSETDDADCKQAVAEFIGILFKKTKCEGELVTQGDKKCKDTLHSGFCFAEATTILKAEDFGYCLGNKSKDCDVSVINEYYEKATEYFKKANKIITDDETFTKAFADPECWQNALNAFDFVVRDKLDSFTDVGESLYKLFLKSTDKCKDDVEKFQKLLSAAGSIQAISAVLLSLFALLVMKITHL